MVTLPLFFIVALVTSEKEEKQAAEELRIEQQAKAKQRAVREMIIANKQNVPSEVSPPLQVEKEVLPDTAIPPVQTQPDIVKEAAKTSPVSSQKEAESEGFYLIDTLPMGAQKVLKSEIFEFVANMVVLALFSLVFIGPYICRNRAVRILLLRPFGAAKLTSALKKIVLSEVGPVGLVYTLEDRNYKPNMFVTFFTLLNSSFLYMIGPLFRPSVRIASVKSSYTYLKLAGRLSRTYRPSIQNFAIGGQAVNVRCSNSWWRRVIDLLMHSSDVILMDLSIVHEGSSWEIDQLEFRTLMDKSLFICHKDFLDQANAAVERLLPEALRPEIFIYDDKGVFARQDVFLEALNEQVATVVEQWGPKEEAPVVLETGSPNISQG